MITHSESMPARCGAIEFIGGFCSDHQETRCLVARPFTGVVALDADSSARIADRARPQPLELGFLGDTVMARDWQSRTASFRETLTKLAAP